MDSADSAAAVTIRPATSEDVEGIVRTYLESADYHASLDPERYSTPAAEKMLTLYRDRAPQNRAGVTLVAELADQIIGFADVRLEESADPMHREMTYCHIAEIAVVRRYQRRGIGSRLLRAAENRGAQHGAEFASLEYHAANIRAQAFYLDRMGYRVAAATAIRRIPRVEPAAQSTE
jgi:ribosomal protein S18 acetylase RimI-like enzyme